MMKKRSKRSRLRGRKTCGWGSRKKHRGKGSRGGKGMAGTGKKAGQKITYILRYFPDYMGKSGFISRQKIKKEINAINLEDINKKMDTFIKEGIAKKTAEGTEINLPDYKILSKGKLKEKVIVKAKAFSEKAKEKIEAIGGKALEI